MRRHNKNAVVETETVDGVGNTGSESPMAGVLAAVQAPVPPVTAEKITPVAATPVVQQPPKVRRFRVMRERPYVENGMRCIVREGAIVDTASRDIELLRKQGVPLEELAE